ncbi:MAG TPA: bifunctional phosphopantothenoylcysteine decarboxylase/phosphopantothenate--cysteine ligase CoaBC [Myxococcota bacterium]|nr:bifunctional phosphopantothenoylcysteine decarboxylase/phosphopantothenate--cysteine ligase CoaBC [Myxococcota bacterium]
MLDGRRVLLVVTGGIAAYKAAEVLRLCVQAGAQVQVAMTRAAKEFVAPLTFQALSGRPVADALFDLGQDSEIGHIRLARDAELIVVAPASADFIGRVAAGLADDMPTAALLAIRADVPVLLAPAMNTAMWENPFVQRNVEALLASGRFHLVGPESGALATHSEGAGVGRMAEPAAVVAAAAALLGPRDLAGRRVLVTAGPTHEPIDPVRYLGNRSSGKMGYALAAAARARGAEVTLVSGPVALAAPAGVEVVAVERAAEMHRAVMERMGAADVVVKAAAVADFRPAAVAAQKIKKAGAAGTGAGSDGLRLELAPTDDILADVLATRREGRPVVVGFAAETDAVEAHAAEKLRRKPVDLLVVNDVTEPGAGFATNTNRVTLMWPDGRSRALPRLAKREVADRILDEVAVLLRGGATG